MVPGEWPALLGMLYAEILELLSVDCNNIELSWSNRQVNQQRTQNKSNINKDLKDDMNGSVKCNNRIHYFHAQPDKEADIERSAKVTKSIHQEYADVFSRHWMLQRHVFITGQGWYKHHQDGLSMHYQNHSKRKCKDIKKKY